MNLKYEPASEPLHISVKWSPTTEDPNCGGQIVPFPLLELQARYLAMVWAGLVALPPEVP